MNTSIIRTHRNGLRHFGLGVCLALSVAAASAAVPSTVAGTYGTVAIGDLPGMIDRVGTLAAKINPGMTGEALRAQLGMILGDPGLSNIAPGSGLVLVVPKEGKPFLLVETAEGKAQAVSDTIKQRGMQSAVISPKLLAVAPDAAALTAAQGEMGKAAAASLDGNDDKFLVLTFDVDTLIKDKDAQIKGFIKSISEKVASSDSASSVSGSMFTFAGNMITAVGKRTDVAQLKVDISSDGIQFEKTMYPVGGMTAGKPEGPSGAELMKSVPTSGDVVGRYQGYMDMQSVVKTMSAIMMESVEGTDVSQADKDSFNKLTTTAGEGFGDGFAGWINLQKEGATGIYVLSVLNADKANQYIDDALKQISEGAFANLYKSLGLETSATLTKNAGTVDGQPYNSFSISMKPTSGSSANPLAGMSNIKDGKYTIVGGNKMVITLGDASINDAVAAVKAGSAPSAKVVSASTKLPAGGAFYADYDAGAVGEVLKSQNEQAGNFLSTLKGSPILEAGYINDDNLKFILQIPGDLITKAISGIQGMAASKASQTDDDSDSSTAPSTNNE